MRSEISPLATLSPNQLCSKFGAYLAIQVNLIVKCLHDEFQYESILRQTATLSVRVTFSIENYQLTTSYQHLPGPKNAYESLCCITGLKIFKMILIKCSPLYSKVNGVKVDWFYLFFAEHIVPLRTLVRKHKKILWKYLYFKNHFLLYERSIWYKIIPKSGFKIG